MAISPITGSKHVKLVARFKWTDISKHWLKEFKINISDRHPPTTDVFCYQCVDTELIFFEPQVLVGDVALYEALTKISFYYEANKWEFELALPHIGRGESVLEVGCGKGDFLARLKSENLGAIRIGVDSNPAAGSRQDGFQIIRENFFDYAQKATGCFDVVAAFQVLEHVSAPTDFIQALLRCLKPSGKLLISTPNSNGYLKYDPMCLLDMPPHHMTRWSKQTFKALQNYFDVELISYSDQPCQVSDLCSVLGALRSKCSMRYERSLLNFILLNRLTINRYTVRAIAKFWHSVMPDLKGHSHFAVFKKK